MQIELNNFFFLFIAMTLPLNFSEILETFGSGSDILVHCALSEGIITSENQNFRQLSRGWLQTVGKSDCPIGRKRLFIKNVREKNKIHHNFKVSFHYVYKILIGFCCALPIHLGGLD